MCWLLINKDSLTNSKTYKEYHFNFAYLRRINVPKNIRLKTRFILNILITDSNVSEVASKYHSKGNCI